MSEQDPNPEQTLGEFVADMRKELDEFEARWVTEHANNPDQWPMKMRAGDWYDQLLVSLDKAGKVS